MSMTDIMPEKYSRVHSCGNDLPVFPARPEMNFCPKPKEFRSSKLLAANPYYQGNHHSLFFSQKSLLPPTAEFKEEKFSKPKEVVH